MKSKLLLAVAIIGLFGCAAPNPAPPLNPQAIPNDCGNRAAIIAWLSEQAEIPRQTFEKEDEYVRHRSQIRARIWSLRYRCQSM